MLLAIHTRRVRIQRDVVANTRATVFYDYVWPSGELEDFDHNAVSPMPEFLLDYLGVDFLHLVSGIRTKIVAEPTAGHPNDKQDGISLDRLTQLSELRLLELTCDHLRDCDLAKLQRLKYLEHLQLMNATHVTDAGVKEIAKNNQLRHVSISHSKITDDAVRIWSSCQI